MRDKTYPGIGFPDKEFQDSVELKARGENSFRPRRLPRRLHFWSSFLCEFYRKHHEAPKYAKAILRYAEESDIGSYAIVLSGQTSVWVAECLLRKIPSEKVFIYSLGSPQLWSYKNGLDRFSSCALAKSYKHCLTRASESFEYSNENIRKYFRKTEAQPWPLTTLLESSYLPEPLLKNLPKEEGKFIIGLGGEVMAWEALHSLIHALDSTYWELAGRKVEIHYWGTAPLHQCRTRIIKREIDDCERLHEALSSCDVLYFPYWFDCQLNESGEVRSLALLLTYLVSKSVLLFHGPEYSLLGKILKEHDSALLCHSFDIEVIKMNLRKALYMENKDQVIKNAKRLVERSLPGQQVVKIGSESLLGAI